MLCPKCQTPNLESAKFCPQCGTNLTDSPPPSPPESPPETSTSPQPIASLLQNKPIIGVIIALIVLFIAGGTYYLWATKKQKEPIPTSTLQPELTPVPTISVGPEQSPSLEKPSPPAGQKNAGRQFITLEETLNFALTSAGLEYADSARIEKIDLIYTPKDKQWTFEFKSKTNPHKKDQYAETLFDFPISTVFIKHTGEFSASSSTYLKDMKDYSYSPLPEPKDVAKSSYLDLAKQRAQDAGFQIGGIIVASYRACAGCGYTGEWTVDLIQAGEEEKDQKKSKRVVFRDGVFRSMSDATITLSVY